MPVTAPPASIRAALAESAKSAAKVNADVGFGSRQPRPGEENGKSGTWKGVCQLTDLNVNWESSFTYKRGKSKDTDLGVPASTLSLAMVTQLADGRTQTYRTKTYVWVHGDPDQVIPDTSKGFWRRRAKQNIAVIRGWFSAILGADPNDPICSDFVQAVQAISAMLEQAKAANLGIHVEAGWVKVVDPYDRKDPQTGKVTRVEGEAAANVDDYVYKLISAPDSSGGTQTA